jgi:polysaccharide biosynthesis/export protein
MLSGKSNVLHGAKIVLIAVTFSSLAAAQQPANTPASSVGASAAQPAGQAAGMSVPAQAKPNAATPSAEEVKDDSKITIDGAASLAKLGPGDLIDINVYNVPELNTKVRVNNAGDVYLPLIDYVHVQDLTLDEAQKVIQKRLEDGGFVRNPHVTIFVDEANSQGLTILGEVVRPGIYPEPVDRRLYQLISEAGGFTQSASRKITIIRRNQSDKITVDLPRNLGDELNGNVEVEPGDTVTIPRAPIIYVVGDVGRPSGFLIDNGSLTVLQALALAGGTNHTAKMGGARIIRKTPTGMVETTVHLKKMLEAKAPDVTLQADDILFIPVSAGRVAMQKSSDAAMTLATAVGIYAIHP